MAFNTRHPVGSTDPRDQYDNANNFDKLLNGSDPFYPDRLGKLRHSWEGMEYDYNAAQEGRAAQFNDAQKQRTEAFDAFLLSSGYQELGDYAAGINITARNQTVSYNGIPYRLNSSATLPYVTTGNWDSEKSKFTAVGDNTLRQDLENTSDPRKGAALIGRAIRRINSVAELRQVAGAVDGERIDLLGYYDDTHGIGGGAFFWDAASTDADNGVTVFATSQASGRWKRSYLGAVNLEWAGVRNGDEITATLNLLLANFREVNVNGSYQINTATPVVLNSGNRLGLGQSTLTATASANERYDMLRIVDAVDVKVKGGSLIGDRDIHTGTGGEHGYGIFVSGSSQDVLIQNVTTSNFWGDGIYIGAADYSRLSRIFVDRCTSYNNRRQGMSITSGQYIYVSNSEFTGTNGTAPQAGIDVEPNTASDATQKVRYLVIENCRFSGNTGSGVELVGTVYDDSTPENSSILYATVSRCTAAGNTGSGIKLNNCGQVTVHDNNVYGNTGNGILLNIAVKDCTVSENKITANTGYGIYMYNGVDRNNVIDNSLRGHEYGIYGYNADLNDISGNKLFNCNNGILLDQCGYNTIKSNKVINAKYQGLSFVNPDSSYNQAEGNLFHNVGFDTGAEISGRFYQSVVDFRGGANHNVLRGNMMTNESGKAPAASYYYVRNSTTILNKMVHDALQNSSTTRMITNSGPSTGNNEVIELSGLFTYKW